jgi:electron transport complex protein RnfG
VKLKDKILPALVLMIICVVISGLVIVVYNLTYVDNTGVMTDALKDGCLEIFNDKDAEFEIILKESDGEEKIPLAYEGVEQIIVCKDKNLCVFEIVEDGYAKGGLHVLVGINADGAVEGISFVEIKETKGVGTKVEDEKWLENFKGATDKKAVSDVDTITGATFSSKGVKSAVTTALKTYSEHKEEIFS